MKVYKQLKTYKNIKHLQELDGYRLEQDTFLSLRLAKILQIFVIYEIAF